MDNILVLMKYYLLIDRRFIQNSYFLDYPWRSYPMQLVLNVYDTSFLLFESQYNWFLSMLSLIVGSPLIPKICTFNLVIRKYLSCCWAVVYWNCFVFRMFHPQLRRTSSAVIKFSSSRRLIASWWLDDLLFWQERW